MARKKLYYPPDDLSVFDSRGNVYLENGKQYFGKYHKYKSTGEMYTESFYIDGVSVELFAEKNLNNLVKGFYEYFNNRPMTEVMRTKLTKHFEENQEGIYGAFAIWTAIYNLKMDIVNQLNKAAETAPVQGYLNDGTRSQEGFVSQDLKFVDRMGFSAQNLAGRA